MYETILDRKKNPKEGSYTNYLFDKGIDKILKKVGEEATELVIAAKNTSTQNAPPIKFPIGIASNTIGKVLNISPAPPVFNPSSPLKI